MLASRGTMLREEPVLVIAADELSASFVSNCVSAHAESLRIFVVSFMFHSSQDLPVCPNTTEIAKRIKTVLVISLSTNKREKGTRCALLPIAKSALQVRS